MDKKIKAKWLPLLTALALGGCTDDFRGSNLYSAEVRAMEAQTVAASKGDSSAVRLLDSQLAHIRAEIHSGYDTTKIKLKFQ